MFLTRTTASVSKIIENIKKEKKLETISLIKFYPVDRLSNQHDYFVLGTQNTRPKEKGVGVVKLRHNPRLDI